MKLYRTEGVVIRTKTVRDADKTLVLFTRERGKLRVWAHGAAKPGSHKRGAVQPFCRGQFLIAAGREIDTVRQADEIDAHSHLHGDLTTLTCATYVCELVDGFSSEDQPNLPLYRLLLEALARLGRDPRPAFLLSAFTVQLLDFSGFRPELDACLECGNEPQGSSCCYSPLQGGLLCKGCCRPDSPSLSVSLGTIRTMQRLLSQPLGRLQNLRPDARIQRELNHLLLRTVELHLEKQPKTLSFLRELDFLD